MSSLVNFSETSSVVEPLRPTCVRSLPDTTWRTLTNVLPLSARPISTTKSPSGGIFAAFSIWNTLSRPMSVGVWSASSRCVGTTPKRGSTLLGWRISTVRPRSIAFRPPPANRVRWTETVNNRLGECGRSLRQCSMRLTPLPVELARSIQNARRSGMMPKACKPIRRGIFLVARLPNHDSFAGP